MATEEELIAWTRDELVAEVLRLEACFESVAGEINQLVEQRNTFREELDAAWAELAALKAANAKLAEEVIG